MDKIIVVGISGASGAIHAVDFCCSLRDGGYTPIVVVTEAAKTVVSLENEEVLLSMLGGCNIRYYEEHNIGASLASGSFKTYGMVIYPCSINTLSKIAYSGVDNLLVRAADVHLKEGRKLILVIRETPFHLGHLKLMVRVCEVGGIVMPLIFSFYNTDIGGSLTDCFKQFDGRVMDRLGIDSNLVKRWKTK